MHFLYSYLSFGFSRLYKLPIATEHFYIHIPFCRQKCPYCKFALTPIFDDFKKRRYIEYLKNEIREYFTNWKNNELWKKKTIYFWGWTPSILSNQEVWEILDCFPFYKTSRMEISFESNPEDITEKYVDWLLKMWVNRLSVGIQSFNDHTLKAIHRSDKKSIFSALRSIEWSIWKTEWISVNVDFILGLPFSKYGETLENIMEIHATFPWISHTSVYMLEDEKYPKDWKENSLTEEEIQSEFLEILSYFEEKNWHHYELSNFSKPGYECQHNQSYWNHSEYRWFGLSSSSFEKNTRWNNAPSFSGYFSGKKLEEECLSDEQIRIEKMMFWLRTDGFEYEIYDIDLWKLEGFIHDGLLIKNDKKIQLTKTWTFLIDHIMSELLDIKRKVRI